MVKILIFLTLSLSLSLSLFFFFPSLFIESGIAAEKLISPTIAVNPDIYYPIDEILYLEGRGEANSNIEVRFQKEGAKPLKFIVKSDVNGEWVFAQKIQLDVGNWEVRARTIDARGITSSFSNPRIIKVVVTGITIGGAVLKFSFLVFLLTAILIISLVLIFYFISRAKRISREKERDTVGALVERDFIELKHNILRELEHIEKRLEGGELTDEEKEHREHLLRDLKEAEEHIERKLKDMP